MSLKTPSSSEILKETELDYSILELILRNYLNDEDILRIRKAYKYAFQAHWDQWRANGEPYINHPISVAEILAELQLDAQTLMASILHDVLEDTDIKYEELECEFGDTVANLVQGVTKVSQLGLGWQQQEEEVENLRCMLVATAKDLHVIVIKLADRLHNMRTLQYLPRHKQLRIARNTLEIYAPIAHRLGLNQIKWELEDLSFQFLDPDGYRSIKLKVAQKRNDREHYLKVACETLEKHLIDKGFSPDIDYRAKHFYSIYMKMRRHNTTFENIYDLAAIRIITENIGECYAILGEVHSMWRQIEGHFKDYISNPKPNNYRSIHTTVLGPYGKKIEIQIRTREMHAIAEHGIAAHWIYKKGSGKTKKNELRWIEAISRELPDTHDPEEFLQAIRNDLLSSEVFVYTPKGEVHRLPKGATPIDFAYRIHTELGHRCHGAKVNGLLVSLDYSLETGDAVEILTNQKAHPSPAWLEFVKTSSARNKIRRFLLEDQRDTLLQRGQSTLTREILRAGFKPREFFNSNDAEEIALSMGLKNLEDLFVNVGFGRISTKQVISRILQKNKPADALKEQKRKTKSEEEEQNTGSLVRLADIDDIMYRIARCCNPIPGDDIVGFVTRGRGVTIHKTSCRNVVNFNGSPERILPLFWSGDQGHPVSVRLELRANDRRNLLSDVSQLISSTGTNIKTCNSETNNQVATFIFTLEVVNTNHLNTVMQQLLGVNGVKTVRRLRPQNKNGSSKKSHHK